MTTVDSAIKSYVQKKIEEFCERHKISKKAWFRRGIITKEPHGREGYVFHLSYKHFFKKCHEKIIIPFNWQKNFLGGFI